MMEEVDIKMPFKSYERVIYRKNPLVQVLCQLRFPRILKINEKQPADFQERIREKYPRFQTALEQQISVEFDVEANVQIPHIQQQSEAIKNYMFSTVDETWHINLTSTFLALSTSKYDRWESFKENLAEPLQALIDIYKPAFFERVGLRYIDVFKRSSLNIEDVNWSDLIEPFALGFMSNTEIQMDVLSQNTVVELDIGDDAIAQVRLSKTIDAPSGFPMPRGEEVFIVDSDMYVMQKNFEELDKALDNLHSNSTGLIRSIIKEKLHNAMEPEAI